MLKRNGEHTEYSVPGFKGKLTSGEMDAYNEAITAIKGELEALQAVKAHLKEMKENPVLFTVPQDGVAGEVIEIPNPPNEQWQICSTLLKLRNSETFLCERCIQHEKEFAAIERFRNDSPYAQANGNAEVLLKSDDPLLLVQDYNEGAQHTLRFIASNLVSKAHKVVWQRYANSDPARVVRAVSERCAQAASLSQNEDRKEEIEQRQLERKAVGNRV